MHGWKVETQIHSHSSTKQVLKELPDLSLM